MQKQIRNARQALDDREAFALETCALHLFQLYVESTRDMAGRQQQTRITVKLVLPAVKTEYLLCNGVHAASPSFFCRRVLRRSLLFPFSALLSMFSRCRGGAISGVRPPR